MWRKRRAEDRVDIRDEIAEFRIAHARVQNLRVEVRVLRVEVSAREPVSADADHAGLRGFGAARVTVGVGVRETGMCGTPGEFLLLVIVVVIAFCLVSLVVAAGTREEAVRG